MGFSSDLCRNQMLVSRMRLGEKDSVSLRGVQVLHVELCARAAGRLGYVHVQVLLLPGLSAHSSLFTRRPSARYRRGRGGRRW